MDIKCIDKNKITVVYEVKNTSLSTAVNVRVNFITNPLLFYYSHSVVKGIFNSSLMLWKVGNLLAGESQFIYLVLNNTSKSYDTEHTIEATATSDNAPESQDLDILKFNCTELLDAYISDDDFIYTTQNNEHYSWL